MNQVDLISQLQKSKTKLKKRKKLNKIKKTKIKAGMTKAMIILPKEMYRLTVKRATH